MTENNSLPPGWVSTTFGDVVEKMANGISRRQDKDGNGTPVTRIQTISDGTINLEKVGYLKDLAQDVIDKYRLQEGDIQFSHINSDFHLGKTAIYSMKNFTLLHGMNLLLLRTNKDVIVPSFLHYLCNHYRFSGYFISIAQHAVNQSSINQKTLKSVPIPLPPFSEQERIVAKIEELFTQLEAGVAELQQARDLLQRYRQAVLKSAVAGELTREWRKARGKGGSETRPDENGEQLLTRILSERRAKWEAEGGKGKYKEPVPPDTDGLPELPEGWVWATSGYLCDCIVPNRDKPKSFSGDIPWITLPDFNETEIFIGTSKSDLGLSTDEVDRYRAKVIPKGSVVMSCVGRFGITGVVERDLVVNQQLHAFLTPEGLLNAKYLAYALRTQVPFMEEVATATTISYMNKSKCNSIPVPLPPTDEQNRIVEKVERRLSVADEIEKELDQALARSERLRQSILKRAFDGTLVKQV